MEERFLTAGPPPQAALIRVRQKPWRLLVIPIPSCRAGERDSLVGPWEPYVQKSYRFLADWGKQHFDALQPLDTSVRTDFLAAGSSAPF